VRVAERERSSNERSKRSVRARALGAALTVAITWQAQLRDAHADDPRGALVAIGNVDAQAALDASRDSGGAEWHLERVEAAPRPRAVSVERPLAELERAYRDADFTRCAEIARRPPLDPERLLERADRASASRQAVFAAACAYGAGDAPRSEEVARRALARELDLTEALARTTPEFQASIDPIRAAIQGAARGRVTIRVRPARAAIVVDGGAHRCSSSPCSLMLYPGEHLIVVESLGRERRVVQQTIDRNAAIDVALDPAPIGEVRAQLAVALAAGADPGAIEVSRAAATAFGARVVVVLWEREGHARAAIYDRSVGRVVATSSARRDRAGARAAVTAVVEEWRGIVEPSLLEEPLFWVSTAVVAAGAATLVYFLVRPAREQRDYVFVAPAPDM